MKLLSIIFWGYKNFTAMFTGYKTVLLEKSLERYENRLGQLGTCPYIRALCTKTSGWDTKPFCLKLVGYENLFYIQDGVLKFSLIV